MTSLSFMDEKNDLIHLYTLPWEVPQPINSIVLNVSTAVCRAVLKKQLCSKNTKCSISKPEFIIVKPEALVDYLVFATYIKTAARCLDIMQNIFFCDFEKEHKFLFDISCNWAIMHEKTEVNMVAISLNADLTGILVT